MTACAVHTKITPCLKTDVNTSATINASGCPTVALHGFRTKRVCGVAPPKNLEIDHIDRATKIHHAVWSWSATRRNAELAKCQVLCAECHKKKTALERGYKTKPHGTNTSYTNYHCRCSECRKAHAVVNAKYRKPKRSQ